MPLSQARERGEWPSVYDELWQRLEDKTGRSQAASQMVDVLLLCREHPPEAVERAVSGALAAGAIDGRAVHVLCRRTMGRPAAPSVALDARIARVAGEATRTQQTPTAYLAALLEAEVAERAERRERRRLVEARFPLSKRLEDFRFDDNTKIPMATIAALADGGYLDDHESIILVGDSGTGKTHLATALGIRACSQGRRVRFTTLAALANELQEAETRRELARVVARYARIELLILDELGYLALPDGAAELVFQVISERHERASLIITTNLPFGEWGRVFPDPRLAKAVVDRVTHRAHIIDCGTQSWRFTHGLKTPQRARPRGSARLPRDPTDRSPDTPTRDQL